MATITRFDFGQFEVYDTDPSRPQPRQRLLSGMEDARLVPPATSLPARVMPLDDRLQPCGSEFLGDVERRSADVLALWHARPIHSPYLAVDLPTAEGGRERLVLRVTNCESFGLDYVVRVNVMGS